MQKEKQSVATATPAKSSLLEELLADTALAADEETYDVAKSGLCALIQGITQGSAQGLRADRRAIDAMVADIDARLSAQVNAMMHHPQVQHLESAWRGLRFLVDRVDFRENIKVEMLNATKSDLAEDFEDALEINKSGLYRKVYASEYGVFGGQPYGLLVGNYAFDHSAGDVALLKKISQVSAMAHAPFIANAAPTFFGDTSFDSLPRLRDLSDQLEGPQYAKWHALRDTPDSRYLGLCLPRFLLRLPFGQESVPVKAFNFEEDVTGNHDAYLWGHASYAMASRVANSFARYRWSPHIIGPQSGGTVSDLPLHTFSSMGTVANKIPTEILLTERREFELSDAGFIGLTFRKDSDNACFFSANSVQKPKLFGNTSEGKDAETNFRLGTQLPYTFMMTRLAHYIKVMQREQLGSFKDRGDLERELNLWIGQYVADMEDPAPGVRARRPLRGAKVDVEEVPGQPGWFRCRLQVQPHLKYMGAAFTLSLVGRLDRGES